MKCLKRNNYKRIQQALLNKYWKQPLIKQQLYDDLPPISQDEQDILGTAGEARTNSLAILTHGLSNMDTQVLAD